ncbi:unnamed protein product [Adineta ricciae]|uniref:Uncharacterized protein n=1 Tax=Adineta ricciae TaxID=249248 RepID=A0A815WCU6_ADIRI|nr:unnamed protein product [Adineta ricciae]
MYTSDELAADDGRRDNTAVELSYGQVKKTNKIALNLRGLTPSYKAYKEVLARPDIQALVHEAEKGRIKDYDQALQLDQICERRPSA